MRVFNGIRELFDHVNDLPDVGWLFVHKDFDRISKADIESKPFMLAENDEDEAHGLKNYKTWLEAPTFVDVVLSRQDNLPDAGVDDIIAAAIYYLKNDSFIEN